MYLNCKTYFSFRYGTFSTDELVAQAMEAGASTLALTNINNTCDLWDFVDACRKNGLKPIGGAEIRNEDELMYVLIARNSRGIGFINHFISIHLQQKIPFPDTPPGTEDVFVIYPLGKKEVAALQSHEWIGVQPTEINKLFGAPMQEYGSKYVIRQPVTYRDKANYNLHRLLRAIDRNVLLSMQDPASIAGPYELFVPPERLMRAFKNYPFIITNTLQLMDQCSVDMVFETDKNKKVFSASPEDDRILLEKLAIDGMRSRYGHTNKTAEERVIKELKIIDQLGFNAYFLITWDIIRYAQSRGFYYVGRGSGANSIVAYCLQITDVNPIDLDLYFERFLNPYRTSPPDFDIDFSWLDRDEVIDYIFKRYGRDHVALLGMYSTFQHNAVIRELGKVFGLPKGEIDILAENREHSFSEDSIQRLILKYGRMLTNFPNHQSIHPGGMLISEEPIYRYCAIDVPPKGFNTAQLDMFVAEKVGLYKLDILSQRGLGHIKEALRQVKRNRQINIDIHEIEKFKTDPKVAEQIRHADTIGCFYIESPAMRQLLRKLRCNNYITLVAASSIIRPGVAQSGMMRQYIYRFHNPDKFEYLHPKMKELLEETYGVMVYQEDVIKVAHHFAGLDMGEADILRRAMSGKYRGRQEFERIRDKFFGNCRQIGHPDDIAKEVWRQIESFSGYSFSKAHSASFAVESYQSLYLKTYYPMEFMVAVINNFGGFYSTELYYHELKRAGAILEGPCVNRSEELTYIVGDTVYVGLVHIQNLEQKLKDLLIAERKRGGTYADLLDFMERTAIGQEQLNTLIRTGAFRFTGKSKKELLWQANFLHSRSKQPVPAGASLFHEPPVDFQLPQLSSFAYDDMLDELELLGFCLGDIFHLCLENGFDHILARDLPLHKGKEVTMIGYFITTKPVRTINKQTMFFGTFIDAAGDWIDTVHFPESSRLYPLQGRGFYKLYGKVVEEFGVYTIEVMKQEKCGLRNRK